MFRQGSYLLFMSIIPLFSSLYLLYHSLFISVEFPLISMFSMHIPISFLIDWMSLMFLFTVMFISSMILIFSMHYIPTKEHNQFSIMLLAFVLSMSFLIMSDNIIFMLLGWDGLGLTSFALVVYYQNASSSASGGITIFSNRVGDIFILLSIAFLMSACSWNFSLNENFPKIIMILLMLAACSKSAQFPFSAWLPAAMAAPTPISALVHSSTLVTAGVYLLIRIMNFAHPNVMIIMLLISSATAIYASLSANWEMDMKKIIALSTLSQIAMMMFAISIGSITLAFFHLIIHALFKSMMFLCAGNVIHMSSYQDMRSMGTLLNNSPLITTTLGISSLSLMGLPFMSGFFSKDPIIETIIYSGLFSSLSILMLFSIGMTSAYSLRLISLSLKFNMKSKPDIPLHPSNFMESPLIMMAPLSIFMGSILTWLTPPEQSIIIPTSLKFSIILILTMGLMTGMLLSYTTKNYKKFGQAAISLWFNHFLTTISAPMSYTSMTSFLKNDKTWQEMYGPSYSYNYISLMSSSPDSISLQMLFIIMIMTLSPILIFSI